MTSTGSTSVDSETVEEAIDGQPDERSDTAEKSISWSRSTSNRLRSFAVGGLAGLAGAITIGVLWWLPTLLGGAWLSVDLVLTVGMVLIVVGPLLLRGWKTASNEAIEAKRRSLRKQLNQWPQEWSWMRPVWVGCGAVTVGATIWAFRGVLGGVYAIQLAVMFLPFLLQGGWEVTTTVDPVAGVIETEQPAHTRRRSLEWAVDVRRFDLFIQSVFVFSNRGKRWYEGPHLLSVPKDRTPEVDPLIRQLVDRDGSPPRIGRDERIIIGAVGASMLAIGPLLYLLTGEGALLLIILGPSALVAHFALLHARRG